VLLDRTTFVSFVRGTNLPYRQMLLCFAGGPGPQADGSKVEWLPVMLFGPGEIPKCPELLWTLPPSPGSDEAACVRQLEAELFLELLTHMVPEHGIVLDPTLGEGGTLLAAELRGRVCWGRGTTKEARPAPPRRATASSTPGSASAFRKGC
jgi:hypothetical protein